MSNDREEGEIDSDENESLLRQRIHELETKNAELERIDRITSLDEYRYPNKTLGGYNGMRPKNCDSRTFWDMQRAGQVPTDASSISSVEYSSPKKRKRKVKKNRANKLGDAFKQSNRRTEGRRRKSHHNSGAADKKKRRRKEAYIYDNENCDYISLSSSEYSDGSNYLGYARSRDDCDLYLNRDELRLALAHSKNNGIFTKSLKDRLKKGINYKTCINQNVGENGNVNVKQSFAQIEKTADESDDSLSLEEKELRLIALKSAVLNKHTARKKRNAEVAYSPTDFEQLPLNAMSEDELDLEYIQGDMEVSPNTSPKSIISPLCSDDELDKVNNADEMMNKVDTKPVDMDIVNSDSDYDVLTNEYPQQSGNTVHTEPVRCLSNDMVSYNSLDYSAPVHYNVFMPQMQLESQRLYSLPLPTSVTPPQASPFDMPIVPDENSVDSLKQTNICSAGMMRNGFVKNEQHIKADSRSKDFENLTVDDVSSCDKLGLEINSTEKTLDTPSCTNDSKQDSDDIEEEEAEALRALLLSKIQNMKSSKTNYTSTQTRIKNNSKAELLKKSDESNNFQPISNNVKITATNPTELILKEAVRRLKVQTNNEESINHIGENSNHRDSSEEQNKLAENEEKKDEQEDFFKNSQSSAKLVEFSGKENIANSSVDDNLATKRITAKTILSESDSAKHLESNTKEIDVNVKVANASEPDTSRGSRNTKKSKRDSPKSKLNLNNISHVGMKLEETNEKQIQIEVDKTRDIIEKRKQISSKEPSKKLPFNSIPRMGKIIKPNKVINTNAKIKKPSADSTESKAVKQKAVPVADNNRIVQAASVSSGTRLLTPSELPKVQVNKLIIQLRASDTETSDDNEVYRHVSDIMKMSVSTHSRSETPDKWQASLNTTGDDDSNSMNWQLKAMKSDTPLRIASPSIGNTKINTFDEHSFEQKLDDFLRNARTNTRKITNTAPLESTSGNINAPKSLCHLPLAAQREYTRLVHRMKILEKQKQSKNKPNPEQVLKNTANASVLSDGSSSLKDMAVIACQQLSDLKEVISNNVDSQNSYIGENVGSVSTTTKEACKLKEYETLHHKISASIITKLDNSLQLVEQAKKVKISKLRHEQRLKDLLIEIDETQHKIAQEQEKITRICPEIRSCNEVVIALKRRQKSVFKKTSDFGKSINDGIYRLNNPLKKEIALKSKQLAANIKFVNSIKHCDLKKLEENRNTIQFNESENSLERECRTSKENCNHVDKEQQLKVAEDVTVELQTYSTVDLKEHLSKETEAVGKMSVDAPFPNTRRLTEDTRGDLVHIVNQEKADDTENLEHMKSPGSQHKAPNSLPVYISPLMHLQSTDSQLDPNGIICPYELRGKCEDKDCKYIHLTGNI